MGTDIQYASDPTSWNLSISTPFNLGSSGIAYGKDSSGTPIWAVSGKSSEGSSILYSYGPTNPSGWNGVSKTLAICNGIAYGQDIDGNPLWVSVGFKPDSQYNIISYSDLSAGGRSTPGFGTQVNGIAYGDDGNGTPIWIAVGNDGGTGNNIKYSYDFTTGASMIGMQGFSSHGNGIAYGNGLWVAVGQDAQGYNIQFSHGPGSLDPNWNGAMVFDTRANAIAYGNGLWVAGGYNGESGSIAYSTDPTMGWTPSTGFPNDPTLAWTLIQGFSLECTGIAFGYDTNRVPVWIATGVENGFTYTIRYSYTPTVASSWQIGSTLATGSNIKGIAFNRILYSANITTTTTLSP